MFIFRIWDRLCQELSHYNTILARDILKQESSSEWMVIKHDVETNVAKALVLAKIEAKYNLKATYYVQADLVESNYKILQEIQKLGHEVTYHYDVLDANGGDFTSAKEAFEENVAQFNRFGFDIQTVCPHGNPLMNRDGWSSNKDFFRDKEIAENYSNVLDIVVALPNRLKKSYTYISDAGYGWKEIANIESNDIKNSGDIDLGDYNHLLKFIKEKNRVILSTHPHRWEKSYIKALFNLYRFKTLRFVARRLSSIPFLKKVMSKFYFLAKKV